MLTHLLSVPATFKSHNGDKYRELDTKVGYYMVVDEGRLDSQF